MSYQEFRPRQFQQIPVVVKNILIINVILFVAQEIIRQVAKIDIAQYLALAPLNTVYFKPYQFITYMFMHGSLSHIFFNMFGVYMFGSILENIWGAKRFLNFYLLCGLGAAALQVGIYYMNGEFSYLLGASGALFGLLVAFAMMFPNTYLNIYFFIPVKAKYLVTAYGLFELLGGFLNREGDNVSHFGHLGGLIIGAIIMLIWKRNKTFFY
jgi:membrane associated rhomboid family serine protease